MIFLAQIYSPSLETVGRAAALDLQPQTLTLWGTFSVSPSLEHDLLCYVGIGDVQGAGLGLFEL